MFAGSSSEPSNGLPERWIDTKTRSGMRRNQHGMHIFSSHNKLPLGQFLIWLLRRRKKKGPSVEKSEGVVVRDVTLSPLISRSPPCGCQKARIPRVSCADWRLVRRSFESLCARFIAGRHESPLAIGDVVALRPNRDGSIGAQGKSLRAKQALTQPWDRCT